MPTPTRSTPEAQLDQWNDQLRASPVWQTWMTQRGKIQGGRMVGLSDREQEELERHLAQNGIQIPNGMHIDQGGNLNQKNRLARNIGIGAAIGAGALTGFGLAGMGPMAGALGGGGAVASGAAGGALPSAGIAGLHTAVPGAMASQGISAGLGAGGALASSSLPVAGLMGGPAAITSQGVSQGVGGAADYLGNKPRRSGFGDALDASDRLSPLLQSAISALAGLPALLANNGPTDEEKALMEQARQMQAMQQRRIEHQNPLFSAVTQLAMSRLPTAQQQELKPL